MVNLLGKRMIKGADGCRGTAVEICLLTRGGCKPFCVCDVNSSITFQKAELVLIKCEHAMLLRLEGHVSVFLPLFFKQPIYYSLIHLFTYLLTYLSIIYNVYL